MSSREDAEAHRGAGGTCNDLNVLIGRHGIDVSKQVWREVVDIGYPNKGVERCRELARGEGDRVEGGGGAICRARGGASTRDGHVGERGRTPRKSTD